MPIRVCTQQPTGTKSARSTRTGCLFIGYEHDPDTACAKQSLISYRCRCVHHRGQPALHVRRAAPEQIRAFDPRLKLIPALRRHNIVVTAEIKGSRARSSRRENARAFASHIVETEPAQFIDKRASAFLILIPGWIF
jgi:hypothetical protein